MKEPRIALVVAVARNGIIGRGDGLPWRVSSDLKRFKALTMGKPVIMGRKTWEGLPRRPLPGRQNIVITRQRDFSAPGAEVVASLDEALDAAAPTGEICIIGGEQVFAQALPKAQRIYLTEIDLEPEGDAYFPSIEPTQWIETEREEHARGPKDDAAFVLRTLDRRRA